MSGTTSLSSTSDQGLIDLLRQHQCELIVGRTGKMTIQMPAGTSENSLIWPAVREALLRQARLTPYARVNGIRLRALGALANAA